MHTLYDQTAVYIKRYQPGESRGNRGITGSTGHKNAGGQFQVIIGKDVNDVYDCVCKIANIKTTELDITDGEEAGEKKKSDSRY